MLAAKESEIVGFINTNGKLVIGSGYKYSIFDETSAQDTEKAEISSSSGQFTIRIESKIFSGSSDPGGFINYLIVFNFTYGEIKKGTGFIDISGEGSTAWNVGYASLGATFNSQKRMTDVTLSVSLPTESNALYDSAASLMKTAAKNRLSRAINDFNSALALDNLSSLA